MRVLLAAVFLFATTAVAVAAPSDTLLEAVGFALTANDNAVVQVIDRSNCVFGIGTSVFHLNNIATDRITLKSWVTESPMFGRKTHVTVALHGDATIYETDEVAKFDHSNDPGLPAEFAALMKKDRVENPEQYMSHHITSKEHTLSFETDESDRVQRAWKYIYAHGCVGAKSHF